MNDQHCRVLECVFFNNTNWMFAMSSSKTWHVDQEECWWKNQLIFLNCHRRLIGTLLVVQWWRNSNTTDGGAHLVSQLIDDIRAMPITVSSFFMHHHDHHQARVFNKPSSPSSAAWIAGYLLALNCTSAGAGPAGIIANGSKIQIIAPAVALSIQVYKN